VPVVLLIAGYVVLVRRPTPRNLILISIDTLRADHLGAYGYAKDTSPHLDRLAHRSVVFRTAVAQAPTTLPSHAVLLTSRYWSATNLPGERPPVPDEWVTLAELLQAQGFATWGFVDGGFMGRRFGFAQGFEHFDDRPLHVAGILGNVERWLDTHAPPRFFLFIHCYDVHSPYQPPPPFDTMFEDVPYPGDFAPTAKNLEDVVQWRRTLTPEDLRHVVALYDGGIRYTDEQLGRFFESLERRGLLDTSVLVLLSDHGEEFLEHGSMLHWQMHFTPNLHVPLIFSIPGHASRSVEGPAELADFLPTVLELLGLPPHGDAMGRSLVRRMEHADARDGSIAYAESFSPTVPLRTVVSDHYQLHYNLQTGEKRLFDIRTDPRATTDLVKREPGVTAALLAVLQERQRRVTEVKRHDGAGAPEPLPLDPATREQLRALGYVE
jgi:arylsulfatase A-like enzyme